MILVKSLPLSGLPRDMRLHGSGSTSSGYSDQSSPKILILWGESDREARVPGKGGRQQLPAITHNCLSFPTKSLGRGGGFLHRFL